jgi:hypothetical protein
MPCVFVLSEVGTPAITEELAKAAIMAIASLLIFIVFPYNLLE